MPTSASQDSITVYAELLSNLRQLSVVASLPSLSDASTSASLADNGSVLKVCHQGKTQAIELAAIPQPASLQIPTQPSSELSWRLRLPPSDAPPERFALEDQAPPWSAREVVAGSPITCRACGEALVDKDRVIEWKDLPSDNWAEMMEFWHCHKPVDHTESEGANGEAATSKGYGASNVISAQQGVGLVDVTSFVLSKVDCTAVMVSPAHPLSLSSPGGARSWPDRLFMPRLDMVSDTTPPDGIQRLDSIQSETGLRTTTFLPGNGCYLPRRAELSPAFTPTPRVIGAGG